MRRPGRNGFGIALALAGVLIAGAVVGVLAGARDGESSAKSSAGSELPASPPSALTPKNVPLGPRPLAYWAPVLTATNARRTPGPGAGGRAGPDAHAGGHDQRRPRARGCRASGRHSLGAGSTAGASRTTRMGGSLARPSVGTPPYGLGSSWIAPV